MKMTTLSSTFVIVGGGIAGVTCAEMLSSLSCDTEESVLLLTASALVKAMTNYCKVTDLLESFDVEERPVSEFEARCPNVRVLHKVVTSLDCQKHILHMTDGTCIQYKKLCICTGGIAKVIGEDNAHVLGIRDTESVQEFQKRLHNARRIMIVGNGGIATEMVYEIEGCEIIWAVKDESIVKTFVDAGAATFFLPQLDKVKQRSKEFIPVKRLIYKLDGTGAGDRLHETVGGALGPDWAQRHPLTGTQSQISHRIHVEYQVEVRSVLNMDQLKRSGKSVSECFQMSDIVQAADRDWPVYVELTNGCVYGCDFVVSATGVIPNTQPFNLDKQFELAEDGGLCIDNKMQTSIVDIYAAGDVCTACWEPAPHWHQMRLWSQARQMGAYAAKCMLGDLNNESIPMDFCFELFAHVTRFFNYKVILLGKFNGQGFGTDYEMLLRVTKDTEYVKVILQNGRMQGAILIGETDLEETFENLILDQLDLTDFKEHMLDPNIDIDHFFD